MSQDEAAVSKPVVTLFESYGSGAEDIGPRVAKALGVPFVGQAFTSESLEDAEERAEVQESGMARLVAALRRIAQQDALLVATDQREEYRMAADNIEHVRVATSNGAVILGHNATVVLADNPRALHVKLDGPLEQRVARAATAAGISIDRARKRQVREDRVRSEMAIALHNWDPRTTDRFDLIVNTGSLDIKVAVQLIVAAYRLKAAAVQSRSGTTGPNGSEPG